MSEMFCYLRDGACCTVVLVKAPAEQIVAALGESLSVGPGGATRVCQIASSDWARVELARADELKIKHAALEGYEAIPLLLEAASIARGQIPEAPLCYETPVSTAAWLSKQLQADTVGIWASDQGPSVGGLAEFEKGQLTRVITTLDPDKLTALRRWHLEDDDEADEDGDAFEDLEDQHYRWPEARYLAGEHDVVGDARIAALGLDLELLSEPLG